MGAAAAVFRKELTDALRDRRSLTAALVYSLLGPLLMALALGALARRAGEAGPLRLAVAGGERAPALMQFLREGGVEIQPIAADGVAALRRGDADLVLAVPEGYPRDFRAGLPATLELVFDSTRRETREPRERLRSRIEAYGRREGDLRLLARGVSPDLARPVALAEVDLATAAGRAALALDMLPIFLLMAAFIGGMNTAIDVTAGERERGSLEPLLMHPVRRQALAFGKWLAASVPSVAGLVLTLLVAQRVVASERLQALELQVALGGAELRAMLAVLLPLALLAPALQMLVALFSHNFKEAQTYLSLLLFAPMLPGFAFAFGSLEPARWMEGVPLLGHQVLLSAVLRGEAPGGGALVLAASTLAGALAAVAATGRLLRHERIVLGR
jgi:sodium transport system permease protein